MPEALLVVRGVETQLFANSGIWKCLMVKKEELFTGNKLQQKRRREWRYSRQPITVSAFHIGKTERES